MRSMAMSSGQTSRSVAATARALARGWQLPLVGVGLLALAFTATILPTLMSLPRLGSGLPVVAPMAGFYGWWCAMLALTTSREPCIQLFITAHGAVRWTNLARTIGVAVCGMGCVALADGAFATTAAIATASLLGEGLAFAALVGSSFAWLLPTLHVMAAAVLGAANRSDLAGWAWILQPHPTGLEVTSSLIVLFIGVCLWGLAMRGVLRPGHS